jgi:acetylornithine deacetylase/succinyl-diaminopimelate desuccinylase-like protein
LTINGLSGGYQGAGPKAVIPASARAKLNIRLVPEQQPDEIEVLLRRYIASLAPGGNRVLIRRQLSAKPAVTGRLHPAMGVAKAAYRAGFGAEPVLLRSGGTISAVSLFQEKLGIATVLMGFALPDDGMHASNEKFYLPNFFNGITTAISFLSGLDETSMPGKAQSSRGHEFAATIKERRR